MEERTQIKFKSPDIDGTSSPQTIVLEQENPSEGEATRSDGETFTWHKWLCTDDQYFMASGTLNAMLKAIPNKTGNPVKIEKVENPKGGLPFFLVNGMNKDQIANQVGQATVVQNNLSASMPPKPMSTASITTEMSIESLNNKIDTIIEMLSDVLKNVKSGTKEEEGLPF